MKVQVSAINSYCDCEFLKLNNKFGTFPENVNTILNYIAKLRERPRLETPNINDKKETIKPLIEIQAKTETK